MKKTYQTPTSQLTAIDMEELMLITSTTDGGLQQNLGEAPETTEASGNLSRRNSLWDDDVEEEF